MARALAGAAYGGATCGVQGRFVNPMRHDAEDQASRWAVNAVRIGKLQGGHMVFRFVSAIVVAALALVPLAANAWETPARGSAQRTLLMDAVRPHAEWYLGGPIVFVVNDLRINADIGFASLHPVRPGGAEITRKQAPDRPGWDNPFDWGGVDIQVLYQRSGETWVAVHHVMGATDVWWADPVFCPTWGAVIPEVC